MHTAYTHLTPLDRHADRNVGGAERLASAALGGALIAAGARRRSAVSLWSAAAGAALVYRGLSGTCPLYSSLGITTVTNSDDTRVALGGDRGIHVRDAVRIERPMEVVYRFWRRLENLPRFLTHLERVTEFADGRSHWVAKGPAGRTVEWDAAIINEIENKVIGWRTLPGADIVSAGSVNFDAVRGGRSAQVTVHLQYAAPAGPIGAVVATLFGREPSQTIREDLRRLKQLLEAGEIPRASASSSWSSWSES